MRLASPHAASEPEVVIVCVDRPHPRWPLYAAAGLTGDNFAEFNIQDGLHSLLIGCDGPTAAEIASFTDTAIFTLTRVGPVIVLCYRIGLLPWGFAPFTIHLVHPDARQVPEPEGDGGHAFVHISLVDSRTGLVRAMRACTFSAAFTRQLEEGIIEQLAQPWDADAYRRVLARVEAVGARGLREMATVKCQGGD